MMSVRPLVCVEEFGSSLSQPASLLIAMMAQEVGAVEKQVAGSRVPTSINVAWASLQRSGSQRSWKDRREKD